MARRPMTLARVELCSGLYGLSVEQTCGWEWEYKVMLTRVATGNAQLSHNTEQQLCRFTREGERRNANSPSGFGMMSPDSSWSDLCQGFRAGTERPETKMHELCK